MENSGKIKPCSGDGYINKQQGNSFLKQNYPKSILRSWTGQTYLLSPHWSSISLPKCLFITLKISLISTSNIKYFQLLYIYIYIYIYLRRVTSENYHISRCQRGLPLSPYSFHITIKLVSQFSLNPLTPKILLVILLTVFHTVLWC